MAVVSWNTRELLADCLTSLRADAMRGDAEVWVVDNASSDGSAALVSDCFPWVTLVASEVNLGFGPAVNLVAERTDSEWVAPANADLRFEPDALRVLLARGRSHPEAGMVAPRLVLPDGATQHSAYAFPTVPYTLGYISGLAAASQRLALRWCLEGSLEEGHSHEVPWAVGAFLLVRRAAWQQIGGFDAGQWMYAEDLDLGWRLRRAGWTVRYEPEAIVHHVESAATTQAFGDDRYVRWHAATYAWLVHRRGSAYARTLAAINVIGFWLRAGVLTLPALRGRPGARAARQSAKNAVRAHAVGFSPRRGFARRGSRPSTASADRELVR